MAKKDATSGRMMLLGIGALSIVLWIVPELRILLWPLTMFNTFIHEICHAAATVLTLGQVEHIIVHADGNGETMSVGGFLPIIASAGYLGSSLVGTVTLFVSRNPKISRMVLFGFAFLIAISLILLVRGTPAGFLTGVFWVGVLGAGARFLKGDWLVFAARILGFQLCLTSVQALTDLVFLSHQGSAVTDAKILNGATGIPTVVWAYLWCTVAFAGMAIGLYKTWKAEGSEPGKRVGALGNQGQGVGMKSSRSRTRIDH